MKNPILSRSAPFITYIFFLMVAGYVTDKQGVIHLDPRWIYPAKALTVALLLVVFWKAYEELNNYRLKIFDLVSSLIFGVLIFILWINMDISWMTTGPSIGFDPRNGSGQIDWTLALPRLLGAAIVVPVMEELFWRSFIMRWIQNQHFLNQAPEQVGFKALILSSVLFGIEHSLWLAGIVAGLAYGWLYIKTRNLWAPIIAHGITNGLLGLWVLKTGQWQFW